MLHLEHCSLWFRDLDTTKPGAEIYGDHQKVLLEEIEEDKMI